MNAVCTVVVLFEYLFELRDLDLRDMSSYHCILTVYLCYSRRTKIDTQ